MHCFAWLVASVAPPCRCVRGGNSRARHHRPRRRGARRGAEDAGLRGGRQAARDGAALHGLGRRELEDAVGWVAGRRGGGEEECQFGLGLVVWPNVHTR